MCIAWKLNTIFNYLFILYVNWWYPAHFKPTVWIRIKNNLCVFYTVNPTKTTNSYISIIPSAFIVIYFWRMPLIAGVFVCLLASLKISTNTTRRFSAWAPLGASLLILAAGVVHQGVSSGTEAPVVYIHMAPLRNLPPNFGVAILALVGTIFLFLRLRLWEGRGLHLLAILSIGTAILHGATNTLNYKKFPVQPKTR